MQLALTLSRSSFIAIQYIPILSNKELAYKSFPNDFNKRSSELLDSTSALSLRTPATLPWLPKEEEDDEDGDDDDDSTVASKYELQEQPLPEEERCAVEEVALVVPETNDTSLPVMTFRAWFLGLTSCVILIFLNTFFIYRTQPLTISAILMQIAVLPIRKFMAATLPERKYIVLGWVGASA
ncbi:hypothetical protein LguiA_025487 [Lonicera macranthoides]